MSMNAPPVIQVPAFPSAHAVDLSRMLLVLSSLENPKRDPFLVGPRGERGLWQMKETTWKDTTGWPYRYVTNPLISRHVARERLLFCERELAKAGFRVSVRTLALCWREGLDAVIHHKYQPKEIREYGIRAENLYRSP
jgi:hypothetical protein